MNNSATCINDLTDCSSIWITTTHPGWQMGKNWFGNLHLGRGLKIQKMDKIKIIYRYTLYFQTFFVCSIWITITARTSKVDLWVTNNRVCKLYDPYAGLEEKHCLFLQSGFSVKRKIERMTIDHSDDSDSKFGDSDFG